MQGLTGNLARDLDGLLTLAGHPADWRVRRLRIGGAGGRRAAVVYAPGLVNVDLLQRDVLGPLLSRDPSASADPATLAETCLPVASYTTVRELPPLQQRVNRGQPALLVDGSRAALALAVVEQPGRSIESPPQESGLRGPRDGFVEDLETNLALLRRRVTDSTLRIEQHTLGRRSRRQVALVYIADLAPVGVVDLLRRQLQNFDYEGLLDVGQLGLMLQGHRKSPFPLYRITERPDVVQAGLIGGRVAVLVDGSPGVLLQPAVLLSFLWAPDDYYTNYLVALIVRVARVAGLLAVVYAPALYVGVELYNPGLLRTSMALFLAGERTGLPFNAATEIIFLELMMEMIHEATLRLPARVGSAATIVGGLIVGQAAVQARLLSSVVIIVVAMGAIGSFTFADQEMARVWRGVKWVVILFAMTFGLYGVFIATVLLLLYLNSLSSAGVPYLAPMAPVLWRDLARDFIQRRPWASMHRRSDTFRPRDPTRGPGIRGGKTP